MTQIQTKLTQLRLKGMLRTWEALAETRRIQEISFSDGVEMLLQAEEDERRNNRFERLLKSAKFRYQASLEELNYNPERELDKNLITELATCQYIANGQAIVVTGSTGCGKSWLVSALGHQACSHGYTVEYFNTRKFMRRIKMARSEGTILRFFDKIAKTSLLILDDFGLTHLEQQQQFDLMEIIEDRHGKKSTIIASQLPIASWYDIIRDATIADGIIDRLIHTAYRIEIKGPSLRGRL
jgi:DNA replication protein DnaC